MYTTLLDLRLTEIICIVRTQVENTSCLDESLDTCVTQNQNQCLTDALNDLRTNLGDKVPSNAEWIQEAHVKIITALDELTEINDRIQQGENTDQLVQETSDAISNLTTALTNWVNQATN